MSSEPKERALDASARAAVADLAARAAAMLDLAPRPSRVNVRAARRLYVEALHTFNASSQVTPINADRLPLRQLSQLLQRLLWRARLASFRRFVRAHRRRCWLALGALVVVTSAWVVWRVVVYPELLEGRPFRTSSDWAKCDPARASCGGSVTHIFFHTIEEQEPFVEYDLGRVVSLRRVVVTNRRDGATLADRAVPLRMQTSLDGKSWQLVARRDYWFDIWRADLPPTPTRYLRLSVARRSILHLERVQAWE